MCVHVFHMNNIDYWKSCLLCVCKCVTVCVYECVCMCVCVCVYV